MKLDQLGKKPLLQVLSLLLAVLIFLFIFSETQGEIQLKIPIKYENLPAGMVIETPPPAYADLIVTGPRILLFRLWLGPEPLHLDLQGVNTGVTEFQNLDKFIRLDPALRIKGILPAEIKLSMQPAGRKKPD